MSSVRGLRGATTSDYNTKKAILDATSELLAHMLKVNQITHNDIAAAIFTTTEDLNAEFPAVAARRLGWQYVALLDSHEMKVPKALNKCIRVLLLVNTDKNPQDLVNVYLKGAQALRGTQIEDREEVYRN